MVHFGFNTGIEQTKKQNSVAVSPQANYTDWVTAAASEASAHVCG
jgi:hypothetical protein